MHNANAWRLAAKTARLAKTAGKQTSQQAGHRKTGGAIAHEVHGAATSALVSLSRLREGWGGGASAWGRPAWIEPPPAPLFERVGLPRKRERRREHRLRWGGYNERDRNRRGNRCRLRLQRRGRDIAAARSPARFILCLEARDPAVARRLL